MIDEEVAAKFWQRVQKTDSCWLWTGPVDHDGYGLFSAPRWVAKRTWRAHRLAWSLTTGGAAAGMHVCHHCDNPPCVNPAHLFLGTAKDNFHDCLNKGRYSPKGTGNAAAKLTPERAQHIRDLYARGALSQQAIANDLGVHQTTVSSIIRGKRWKAA